MLISILKSYIRSEAKIQICCLKDILCFSANSTSLTKKNQLFKYNLIRTLKNFWKSLHVFLMILKYVRL